MATISARYLGSIYQSCLDLGVRASTLCALVPGAPASLKVPTTRFQSDILLKLLRVGAQEIDNPALALEVGARFRPSTFLDIGYGMIACANLREAVAFNHRYQPLTQEIGRTSLIEQGDTAHLRWITAEQDVEQIRPATEAAFAGYAVLGRWLLWRADQPIRSVHFRHKKPAYEKAYEGVFQAPVFFEAEYDEMRFDAAVADMPMPQANADLIDLLTRRLDRALQERHEPPSVGSQVRQTVQSLLSERAGAEGAPELRQIAALLGFSERTLRRRLAEEGTNFREVLSQARKEACEIYLKENRWSVAEMAQHLGYSEQSALSRAFRQWYGMSPTDYQAQLGG